MRKRSEVVKERKEKGPEDLPKVEGLYCRDCGLPQCKTPDGQLTCANGHGGAESVNDVDGAAIRARALGREAKPEDVAPRTDMAPSKKLMDQAKVDQVSAALKKELEDTPLDPLAWGKGHEAKVDPAFQAIIEKLVVDDPTALYERLERIIVIGENRNDHHVLTRELDNAEKNARDAHRLFQAAIIERKRWELENEIVFGAMRVEATKALQREKDQGLRNKAITDADVESKVAVLFKDEYGAQEVRRLRLKSMVDSMQNLSEMWVSRCRTLQTLLSKQR